MSLAGAAVVWGVTVDVKLAKVANVESRSTVVGKSEAASMMTRDRFHVQLAPENSTAPCPVWGVGTMTVSRHELMLICK